MVSEILVFLAGMATGCGLILLIERMRVQRELRRKAELKRQVRSAGARKAWETRKAQRSEPQEHV